MEPVDISVAVKKLHQLALEDGDLGALYWNSIIRLLRSASALERDNLQLRKALGERRDDGATS